MMAVARPCSGGVANLHVIRISGFVGDIMFAHNGQENENAKTRMLKANSRAGNAQTLPD